MASSDGSYAVVWPRGRSTERNREYSRRLDTLEGKTIGELWNWSFKGDKIFPMLRRELSRRYSGVEFVTYDVFGSIEVPDGRKVIETIPDRLRQNKCDAVIVGVGC